MSEEYISMTCQFCKKEFPAQQESHVNSVISGIQVDMQKFINIKSSHNCEEISKYEIS